MSDVDYAKKLNGVDIRYWKLIGETLSYTSALELIGKGQKSILVFLNLLNYKVQTKATPLATKILSYIQQLVINIYF